MDKCFANLPSGCRALKVKRCAGCAFLKTQKDLIESQKKTLKRIELLDISTQLYIAKEYEEFRKVKRKFSRKDDLYEI